MYGVTLGNLVKKNEYSRLSLSSTFPVRHLEIMYFTLNQNVALSTNRSNNETVLCMMIVTKKLSHRSYPIFFCKSAEKNEFCNVECKISGKQTQQAWQGSLKMKKFEKYIFNFHIYTTFFAGIYDLGLVTHFKIAECVKSSNIIHVLLGLRSLISFVFLILNQLKI